MDDLIQTALTWLNRTDSREVALMRRKLKNLSIDCLEQVYPIFGEGAFRKELKRSNPINMNIFETTMYFMALMNDYDLTGMEKIIKEEVYEVITSNQYLSCLSDSRESYQKVSGKSTLLQAILLAVQNAEDDIGLNGKWVSIGDFREVRNYYMPGEAIRIEFELEGQSNPQWVEFSEDRERETCVKCAQMSFLIIRRISMQQPMNTRQYSG